MEKKYYSVKHLCCKTREIFGKIFKGWKCRRLLFATYNQFQLQMIGKCPMESIQMDVVEVCTRKVESLSFCVKLFNHCTSTYITNIRSIFPSSIKNYQNYQHLFLSNWRTCRDILSSIVWILYSPLKALTLYIDPRHFE